MSAHQVAVIQRKARFSVIAELHSHTVIQRAHFVTNISVDRRGKLPNVSGQGGLPESVCGSPPEEVRRDQRPGLRARPRHGSRGISGVGSATPVGRSPASPVALRTHDPPAARTAPRTPDSSTRPRESPRPPQPWADASNPAVPPALPAPASRPCRSRDPGPASRNRHCRHHHHRPSRFPDATAPTTAEVRFNQSYARGRIAGICVRTVM